MSVLSPTKLQRNQSRHFEVIGAKGLRLVVTLAVCDCLFPMPPVDERETNVTNVPFLILELFQDLDPHVWDGHG